MFTVDEALEAILKQVQPFEPTPAALTDALGLVLSENVISDIDSPPFDKSLMDGFAVQSTDVTDGTARLDLIEEIMAGQVPQKEIAAGQATRIMTGAPLPSGCDAVVPVENTSFDSQSQIVSITTKPLSSGANLMRRGTSMKQGECIIPTGRQLRPQELGILAELGEYEVSIRRRPRIAVLATGDELVPVEQKPGPGQIRNSNETMLVAQIQRAGAEPIPLGIARDERVHLREKIEEGLSCDMLLLSGGVSAGQLDLVPSELQSAGVREVFHKVNLKPGKPIWFGHRESRAAEFSPCTIFGLPGNPVSSMVCFELFARTAIRRMMGFIEPQPRPVRACLAEEHIARSDRPTYHPATLSESELEMVVRPVKWHGSSDLRATAEANAMILFPPGKGTFHSGDSVTVFRWD